jgi:hypothetical protein
MTENGTRMEGRVMLAPPEKERLLALMRRSDAFTYALCAVEAEEGVHPGPKTECLEVLGEAHREAHEAFWRYRAELGLPDRPTRKNV